MSLNAYDTVHGFTTRQRKVLNRILDQLCEQYGHMYARISTEIRHTGEIFINVIALVQNEQKNSPNYKTIHTTSLMLSEI